MPRESVILSDDDSATTTTPASGHPVAAASNGLPEDAELVNALLDSLVQEQNPWEYIDAITTQRVPPEHRMQFYEPFIALVAARPPAEQDAILAAGQPIFRYRTDTARADVKRLRAAGAEQTRVAPFVDGPDFLAEIVYVADAAQSVQFLVYREADGHTEIAPAVQVGPIRYVPPQSQLVAEGTILLPTGITEYGESSALFQEIKDFIAEYLYLEDPQFRNLVIYYILLVWVYDRFDVVPYLRAIGDWGTGKTRLLQVVGYLGFRTIVAGGATTAAPIFRLIQRFHGTLVLDELDFTESDMWSELTKILNMGYIRGFRVLRAERSSADEKWGVEAYDCYGPKVLSTRKRFRDQALESRCLSYTMGLNQAPAHIPLYLDDEFRARATALRNKLLLWRFRRYRAATPDPRQRIAGLDSRLNQILLPLLAMCDDDTMRADILAHAAHYQAAMKEDQRESMEGRVAATLLQRWAHRRTRDAQTGAAVDAGTITPVQLKEVVESLKIEFGDAFKADSKSVGNIVRSSFGLHTFPRGGSTWASITAVDAAMLAQRYAIPDEAWHIRDLHAPAATSIPARPASVAPRRVAVVLSENGTDG